MYLPNLETLYNSIFYYRNSTIVIRITINFTTPRTIDTWQTQKEKKKKPIPSLQNRNHALHASKDPASDPWPNSNSSSPRFPIARIFPSHSSIPTNTVVGSRLPITHMSRTMSQHLFHFPSLSTLLIPPRLLLDSTSIRYKKKRKRKTLNHAQSNPKPYIPLSIPLVERDSIPLSNRYQKKKKNSGGNEGEKDKTIHRETEQTCACILLLGRWWW